VFDERIGKALQVEANARDSAPAFLSIPKELGVAVAKLEGKICLSGSATGAV
jgi:hypothetical protein